MVETRRSPGANRNRRPFGANVNGCIWFTSCSLHPLERLNSPAQWLSSVQCIGKKPTDAQNTYLPPSSHWTMHITAIISGKVQGVSYRWYAKQKAEEFHLNGHAKNLPDGTVELIAEGKETDIEKFLAWCRRGPPGSSVENIEIKETNDNEAFEGFTYS